VYERATLTWEDSKGNKTTRTGMTHHALQRLLVDGYGHVFSIMGLLARTIQDLDEDYLDKQLLHDQPTLTRLIDAAIAHTNHVES
jgi:hypothetical protein